MLGTIRGFSVKSIVLSGLLLAGCTSAADDFLPERDFSEAIETPESYAANFEEEDRDERRRSVIRNRAFLNEMTIGDQVIKGDVTFFLRGVKSNNKVVFEFLTDQEEIAKAFPDGHKLKNHFLATKDMAAYLQRLDDQGVISIINRGTSGGLQFIILRNDVGCLRYNYYYYLGNGVYKDIRNDIDWGDVFGSWGFIKNYLRDINSYLEDIKYYLEEVFWSFDLDLDLEGVFESLEFDLEDGVDPLGLEDVFDSFRDFAENDYPWCSEGYELNDIAAKEGWVATWLVPLFDEKRIVPGTVDRLTQPYRHESPCYAYITFLAEIKLYDFESGLRLEDEARLARFTRGGHYYPYGYTSESFGIYHPPCARLEMLIDQKRN